MDMLQLNFASTRNLFCKLIFLSAILQFLPIHFASAQSSSPQYTVATGTASFNISILSTSSAMRLSSFDRTVVLDGAKSDCSGSSGVQRSYYMIDRSGALDVGLITGVTAARVGDITVCWRGASSLSFVKLSAVPPPSPSPSLSTMYILIIVLGSILLVAVCCFVIIFVCYCNAKKKDKELEKQKRHPKKLPIRDLAQPPPQPQYQQQQPQQPQQQPPPPQAQYQPQPQAQYQQPPPPPPQAQYQRSESPIPLSASMMAHSPSPPPSPYAASLHGGAAGNYDSFNTAAAAVQREIAASEAQFRGQGQNPPGGSFSPQTMAMARRPMPAEGSLSYPLDATRLPPDVLDDDDSDGDAVPFAAELHETCTAACAGRHRNNSMSPPRR